MLEEGNERPKYSPVLLKRAVVKLEKIDAFCVKDDSYNSDTSVITISSDESSPNHSHDDEDNNNNDDVEARGRKRPRDFNDSGSSIGSRGSDGSFSRSSSFSGDSSSTSRSPQRKSKRPKLFVVPPESLFDHKNRNKRRSSSSCLNGSLDRSRNSNHLDDNLNDAISCNNKYSVPSTPSQRCRDCRQLKNDNPNLKFFPGDPDGAVSPVAAFFISLSLNLCK